MGDVLTLIERAQAAVDEEQAEDLARKARGRELVGEELANQRR